MESNNYFIMVITDCHGVACTAYFVASNQSIISFNENNQSVTVIR